MGNIPCDLDPEVNEQRSNNVFFLNHSTLYLKPLHVHRSHDVDGIGQYLV